MPDRKNIRWLRVRLWMVSGLLVLGTVVVLARIWVLQVSQAKWLEGLAREQYLKEISLEPMRGAILDRHGAPLAVSVQTDSIFAVPAEVQEPARTASALARALRVPEARLRKRLASNKHFTWIKRRTSPADAERVRALQLPGIHFTQESRRFYPAKGLAGALIGFAGDGRGLEGMELLFDGQLRGAVVLAQGLRDARGNILFSDAMGPRDAVDGGGLVLTIDLTVQEITERELQRAVQESGAASGTAVVMDPGTGEVLAMASVPGFNPNTFGRFRPAQWRNRAVTDCYEPGSTLKIFVMAEALQSGKVRLNEAIDCARGSLEVDGHTIRDSHAEGFGTLTPEGILVHSSNIGMAKLGMRLGKEPLDRALRRFGLRTADELLERKARLQERPGRCARWRE